MIGIILNDLLILLMVFMLFLFDLDLNSFGLDLIVLSFFMVFGSVSFLVIFDIFGFEYSFK